MKSISNLEITDSGASAETIIGDSFPRLKSLISRRCSLETTVGNTDSSGTSRRRRARDSSTLVCMADAAHSLPVVGARGVVRLEPLAEREQAARGQQRGRGRGRRPEPAHRPAPVGRARAQRARPHGVPAHRAPHQVAHRELGPRPARRRRLVRLPLAIYRLSSVSDSSFDPSSSST